MYCVPYFSSAGNQARQSYDDGYRSAAGASPVTPLADAHDFDPGGDIDVKQSVTIPAGEDITLSFQGDDPFFSVSGPPGADTDLDIYLLDSAGTPVASSTNPNLATGDPSEILSFTNSGATAVFDIVIEKVAGADPGRIKYVEFDGNITVNEFDTLSGTVFGHANAAGALAVGAAAFYDTPDFGTSPPVVEAFSSTGSVPILFDTAGNRLAAAEIRNKPEITFGFIFCSQRTKSAAFQNSQERFLKGKREFTDFIQKQDAPVGHLN